MRAFDLVVVGVMVCVLALEVTALMVVVHWMRLLL